MQTLGSEPYWRDEKRGLTIYHGDCREIMAGFADDQFGSVITDPPYGINAAEWDVPPDTAITGECLRVASSSVVMFGGQQVQSARHFIALDPERILIWAPSFTMGHIGPNQMCRRYQNIYCWRLPDKQDIFRLDVLRHRTRGMWRTFDHPCKKDLLLMSDLCAAFGGESVLDPYLGSGTTLAACAKLGLPGGGIEISEEYCEMAAARLSEDLNYGEANLFSEEAT